MNARLVHYLKIAGVAIAGILGALLIQVLISGHLYDVLALGRARLKPPQILMIGDSITLQGAPWGTKLSDDPFSAVTFARSGYTAARIAPLTDPGQWGFRPRYVAYMAGTNDAGDPAIGEARSTGDQLANIDRLIASGAKVIVTLAPPTSVPVRTQRTRQFNAALRAELAKRPVTVIDLWPEIARGDVIGPEFTPDGLHFNPVAYRIWARHLKAAME